MKIIDGQMYLKVRSVSELLGVENTTLYYVINKEEELMNLSNSLIKKFPEPVVIGGTSYYNKEHIWVFMELLNIAESYEVDRGKYEKAYKRLNVDIDKIKEMKAEIDKAKKTINKVG